jgi:hypothetical protein
MPWLNDEPAAHPIMELKNRQDLSSCKDQKILVSPAAASLIWSRRSQRAANITTRRQSPISLAPRVARM